MQISKKQYNEYMRLLKNESDGITFDGLRFIIKSNNYDPTEIGKEIIESYYMIKNRRKRSL